MWDENDVYHLARLSAFTRERTLRGFPLVTLVRPSSHPCSEETCTVEEALEVFPKTIAQRLDKALLNLERMSKKPGAWIDIDPKRDYPIAYAEDEEVFEFFLDSLAKDEYIERKPSGSVNSIRLGTKGLNRVADLQRAQAGQKPLQAFVAMCFWDSLEDARKDGFKPGIEDAGYEPLIISEKDFLGDIHDEILAEIRKSRFVVADFTEHRQNVYYEAGFAEALGLPVIYTCHKDHIDKAHFDIRQRNHIVWETPDDLRVRLRQRIEATIGRPTP